MSNRFMMRHVAAADIPAIQALHERAFGPGRFARTAYRVREGLPPFSPLCRLADIGGSVAAAVRMAPITIGGVARAQLLGPLAVEPEIKGHGVGKSLVLEALVSAKEAGNRLVLLVGDLPYYGRFGFNVAPFQQFDLGGPVNPARLLVLQLESGSQADFAGAVRGDQTRLS